jgi:hypothetical protein
MASSRSQLDWFLYQVGMLTFRAFAEGKATWILNYSWDGDKNVDPREAMKNLAMSQVMVGANFWDAPGHSMAGSNDLATRTQIFQWIEKNEKTLYLPRKPMWPVGVYFSPKSRDYDVEGFLPSYRGVLLLLLQTHREFQVVTPRTLASFHGEVLVLPNVSMVNDTEREALKRFTANGGRLVITGQDSTALAASSEVVRITNCPGRAYFTALQRDFASGAQNVAREFLQAVQVKGEIEINAPPTIAANLARVDGTPHVFLANFSGLVPGKVPVPSSQPGIQIRVPATTGESLAYLPFLGEEQVVQGVKQGDRVQFTLPPVERGAVVWVLSKK